MSDLARNRKYPARRKSGARRRVHAEVSQPWLSVRHAAGHANAIEISEMQDEMDWTDAFVESDE